MTEARRFFRDNMVLVAAVVLPAAVALLFIVATVVPTWTVEPPGHDLVLRVEGPYDSASPPVTVDFGIREGRVEATARALPRPDGGAPYPYAPRWRLLLFDHETMRMREIGVEAPVGLAPGETRMFVVETLADRRVIPGSTAPDGYQVESAAGGGAGIVGELFGMNRYRRRVALTKDGRRIQIDMPSPAREWYGGVYPLGWIADER